MTVESGAGPASAPPATKRAGVERARSWLIPMMVIACFCLPLFVGLGRADLANDEAIYSFSVDVMVESGDWLVPKASPYEDLAFLEKPPLKAWIVAAPIKLGLLPRDEFGLRFWDALFGGIAFLYVFAIGRRLAGPLCGVVAVLVLFLHHPLLFEHGLRENTMEAPLLLCYCGAMYHFLAWRTSAKAARSWLHIVAIGLYFVLGFMCKFVAALFLPMLLAFAMLLRREDRQRAIDCWRAWCGTTLLVVALCAPWFLYAYYRFGTRLWSAMLGSQVVTRFTSSVDPRHLQPWHYYFWKLVGELQSAQLVWLALAGAALFIARVFGRRVIAGRSGGADALLMLIWFAVPLVLISYGTSKLYHYIYPFLPPVALAVGYCVATVAIWGERLLSDKRFEQPLRTAKQRGQLLSAARSLLVAVAALCIALAVLVLVLGHVKLAVGDVLLLRTSTALRPLLVAFFALLLAARGRLAARVVVPLIALAVPLQAYRSTVLLLATAEHPLRSLAVCMQPIARQATGRTTGPGTYAETETLIHPLTYYLRALGPWHQVADRSDAKVYATLYLKQQPVLLSHERQEEFNRALDGKWAGVIPEAARMAGVDVAMADAARWAVELRAVPFPSDTLLLPGPYARCAPEKRRVVR